MGFKALGSYQNVVKRHKEFSLKTC